MANDKMTICSHCGASIASGAKTCPSCGGKNKKPIYKRPWFIVLIIIIVICIVVGMGGSDEPTSTAPSDDSQKQEQQITYTEYNLNAMVDELENNALKAEKKYNDQYIKVTGQITNIDSDGNYISIEPIGNDFSIYDMQCTIQTEEQQNFITQLNKGDTVTVKGHVTEIGEIIGYAMDIDKIMK